MAQPETMIEARRVGREVRFFPKRWREDPRPSVDLIGEYVPLVYAGADPKSFSTFEVSEACCRAYESRDDSMLSPRWDVDAGRWVEREEFEARGVDVFPSS